MCVAIFLSCRHLASLFAEDTPLPPVMCFAMGTLGFLTPFDAAQFRSCLVSD
jgi:NAD+ kinase